MQRTILITGSATRLGAALAKGLAKDGHRIAIHYRTSRAEAEETRKLIHDSGSDAEIFGNPLATMADAERLVGEILSRFGSLDTLINNAGSFVRKPFDEMTQHEWETELSSTATAAFITTRAALPSLRKSGRGRIINLGDSASDRIGYADPGMSYYIGKVGVWMMTQTLAANEAPHKITVNMVSPGVLEDSMCETPAEDMPLGRYGTSDDVLHPIRFLLDDASGALTGSNLHVGGGWNIKPQP